LKWDLSAIPPGNTIQSVSVTVTVFDKSVDEFEIYELKRNWVESEATWNVASAGSEWQIAGAQGVKDRGSTVLGTLTASTNGVKTLNFNADGLAVVQGWIDQPSTNHGITIQDYTNSQHSIGLLSRETTSNTARPMLTISFLPSGSGRTAVEPDSRTRE
jgi:hypothetical protein